MLTTNILLAEKYDYLSEKFKKAFTFLRDTDLAALPVGNVPIDGNEVYANVQSYSTMDAADCPFESHKEYFDVQYVVEGEECFGYEPVENLIPSVEYDAEKDLIFYQEPADFGSVILKAGDFAIVPPEDGHAPRRMTANGSCHVKKIVVKGTKKLPKTAPTGTFIMPVSGYTLTSEFGWRWGRNHDGLDLACGTGTPIYASDGGTVVYAGWYSGYGLFVEIDHGNGIRTRYGHCNSINVSVGEKVYQGQKIAEVGNTGNSFGSHCHFEIVVNGTPVDPFKYL